MVDKANPLWNGPGQMEVKLACGRLYLSAVWRRVQNVFHLTDRETQIAILVSKGLPVKDIAMHLKIDRDTVRTHLHNMNRMLGTHLRSRLQAKLTLAAVTLAEHESFMETLKQEPA